MTEVRESTDGDATAIREAAAAALHHDPEAGRLPASLERVPGGVRRTCFVVEDGAGAVYASVSGETGYVDLLAVHPSAQGYGWGRALLGAAEEWARSAGALEMRFAGHPPCYAWPGIDVRYTPALCLAERAGYERYDIAWNMTAGLDQDLSVGDDVARLGVAGVDVRSVAAGDRAAVSAFAETQWNDRWAWEVEHATGCHIAVRAGGTGPEAILGFAAWGARPDWFGPMGTAPDAQGLGVGRVLLRSCLADQRAAGLTEVQIGWVGPLRFYSRAVGARTERVFALYRRRLGSAHA